MSLISLLWDRDDSACRLQQSEFGGADCNSLSLEGLPRQDAAFLHSEECWGFLSRCEMAGCEGPLIKKEMQSAPEATRVLIIVTVGCSSKLKTAAGRRSRPRRCPAGGPLQCNTVFRFRRV